MQRDLTTPVSVGQIATLGPGTLTVHCTFDEEFGAFRVSALQLDVREGEVTGSGPYEFEGRKGGSVSRPADTIPASIITEIESLVNRGLELYAAQEGYDLQS